MSDAALHASHRSSPQAIQVRAMQLFAILRPILTHALLAIVTTSAVQAADFPTPKGHPIKPAITPFPTVHGPIAVTQTSWPFAAAAHSVTPRDLSKDGYIEEEYFVSGRANVYEWPALNQLVSFAQGTYTTRILVRRPRDRARFSGTVMVEALNPSLRYDAPVMWMESQNYIIHSGHAYVGVTVKPVAAESLKLFNPQRYAALSFKNPLPPGQTCAQLQLPPAPGGLPPESTPLTENGLIWDILSQVGTLLHSDSKDNPLHSYPVRRVFLTGDSQSGGFVLNYVNAVHPFALRAKGKPVYDGYLTSSASGIGLPMHQCAARLPPNDPRLTIQPLGVPLIKVINQTDITSLNRRPDSDTPPDLYRGYEIAGAAHVHDWVLKWGADDADVAKTGAGGFLSNARCKQHDEPGNEFPTQYILNGALANLDRWSREGVPPPSAEPLRVADPHHGRATLELDELGNARGGVRTPYVDVPLVRYGVYMDGPGICELWGYQVPLDRAVLKRLYPRPSDYVSRVKAATQRSLEKRWITSEDAAAIENEAEKEAAELLEPIEESPWQSPRGKTSG
jgi:hypothetical protein